MKRFIKNFSLSGLKGQMIAAFLIVAVIPAFILYAFSYFNTSRMVKSNAEEMLRLNLQQTKSTLDVWIDSYEDIPAIVTETR